MDYFKRQYATPRRKRGLVIGCGNGWVERDLYDCYISCYWPAQVPDHMNNYPDWTAKCASATKDWRNIDLVFP